MKFQTVKDEDSSPDWDRIKSFVGGANKASKHPLDQEMERLKMRKPQHMDEGGTAIPFDLGMGDLPINQPDPLNKLNIPQRTPQIAPQAVNPAPTAPSPIPTPPVSSSPISAPTDASYENKASNILGGITPEKINELMQTLNQGGKRAQLGAGLAGIGDAIASVGGQNPGHMKNSEEMIQQNKEMGMKLPGEMAAIGKEKYGLSQELQAKDPNSPYSKVVQNSERPTLKKLGWTDAQISSVPATAIQDASKNSLTFEDTQAKLKLEQTEKTLGFGLQKEQIEATKGNQQAQRQQENTKMKLEHPFLNALGKVPDVSSGAGFDHSSIPVGQKYQAPDGTWRIKK